jgi:hypothetical protein
MHPYIGVNSNLFLCVISEGRAIDTRIYLKVSSDRSFS